MSTQTKSTVDMMQKDRSLGKMWSKCEVKVNTSLGSSMRARYLRSTLNLHVIYLLLCLFQSLKETSQSNPFSRVWWYRLFQFFEENVSGMVPRNYQLPLSWRSLQWSRGVKYSKLEVQWPKSFKAGENYDFQKCCFSPRWAARFNVALSFHL